MIQISINTIVPEPLTIEQIENEKQLQINTESLEYLNLTDWYITRFSELTTPIPLDVLENRRLARLAIVKVIL